MAYVNQLFMPRIILGCARKQETARRILFMTQPSYLSFGRTREMRLVANDESSVQCKILLETKPNIWFNSGFSFID